MKEIIQLTEREKRMAELDRQLRQLRRREMYFKIFDVFMRSLCVIVFTLIMFLAGVGFCERAHAAGPPWCFPLSGPVTYADGDSFNSEFVVFPFPRVTMTALVRINGIDAPELNAKNACERKMAQESTDVVLKFLDLPGVLVCIEGKGKDARGRPLVSVYAGETNLRELLVNHGLARPYDGGKRGPWCEDGAK